MQVEFFCKTKHLLLFCSNMGNRLLLVKNFFPFSIDFRTSPYISPWSSLSQKECRESLGRRKAAVLYWQPCAVPELRRDVPASSGSSACGVGCPWGAGRELWGMEQLLLLGVWVHQNVTLLLKCARRRWGRSEEVDKPQSLACIFCKKNLSSLFKNLNYTDLKSMFAFFIVVCICQSCRFLSTWW